MFNFSQQGFTIFGKHDSIYSERSIVMFTLSGISGTAGLIYSQHRDFYSFTLPTRIVKATCSECPWTGSGKYVTERERLMLFETLLDDHFDEGCSISRHVRFQW